jgi:hypothetical protein
MKHLFRVPVRSLVLLLFVVATSGAALAGPPSAPQDLAGTVVQLGNGNWISFTWNRGSADDAIDHYALHRAPGIDATSGFQLVETIGGRDTIDNATVNWTYRAESGSFTYRMTAVNREGESDPSNSVSFAITPLPSIRFTSEPPTVSRVGVELVYDADAVASNGGALKYSLRYYSDSTGVSTTIRIDENTGVLRFTPRWPGWTVIHIVATLADDERVAADHVVRLKVINCSEPTTGIAGTVTDDDGNPIESGYIVYNLIDDEGNEHEGGSLPFSAGAYRLDTLDAGSYRVRAAYGEFVMEWYGDAYLAADATPVVVTCGSMTTANFTLTRRAPYEQYAISGTVRAKSNGNPVPALLRFTGFEKGVPADKRWQRAERTWAWTNDSLDPAGAFSVILPNNYTWIVRAELFDPSGRDDADSLVPQYYDRATHPGAALEIDGATEINFELERRIVRNNGFAGAIINSDRAPLAGYVVAYPLTPAGQDDAGAVTVEVDASGSWRFENIAPGDYVVFAYPYTDASAPGYYRANDAAALTWREATVISVGDEMITTQHNIVLRDVAHGGIAKLYGMVGTLPGRATLRESGGLLKLNPVSGALVAAIDANGGVVGSAVTNRAGQFTIDELPEGNHRVIIDKVGFFSSSETVAIENGGSGTTVELERSEGTSAVPGSLLAAPTALSIYPNPATSRLVLAFEGSEEGTAELTIVDAAGNEVRNARIETTIGANRLTVDLAGLSSGQYIVRIDGAGVAAASSVSVVH